MILISLGSNIENRLDNLRRAITMLKNNDIYILKESLVLETTAILPEHVPKLWNKPFLNMVISCATSLNPHELLQLMQKIEVHLGRDAQHKKYAPRTIDLDLLQYNDKTIYCDNLILPHPELKNRKFLQHLIHLISDDNAVFAQCNTIENYFVLHPIIVGIVNITPDSFSDGGNFYNRDDAMRQISKLQDEGASIIEIGAQSTRPNAIMRSMKEEYDQLCLILDALQNGKYNKLKISIDSFHDEIVQSVIENYDISYVNDVKGSFNDLTLKKIAQKNIGICVMHSLSIPPTSKNIISLENDIIEYLMRWGKNQLDKLTNIGFAMENIILDPGIGFGKNIYQNIQIIKKIGVFQKLGCKIMLGHSRKSYMKAFSTHDIPSERDLETVAITLATTGKVDMIRVHNVNYNMRSLVAHKICV